MIDQWNEHENRISLFSCINNNIITLHEFFIEKFLVFPAKKNCCANNFVC